MSEIPPQYANYPRNANPFGSAAQLQSLYNGYRRYGWMFLLNILLSVLIFVGAALTQNEFAVLLAYPLTATVIGFLVHPLNKLIGFGANWPASKILTASILMGINAVTCGIVGYIVMQQIAVNNIKRYGLKSGFFGLKKREVQQKILDLEAAETGGPRF